MPLLKPDPTFYPSPTMAMDSPSEKFGYVALINPRKDGRPDAIGVVDVDPASKSYGRFVGRTATPTAALCRGRRIRTRPVSRSRASR